MRTRIGRRTTVSGIAIIELQFNNDYEMFIFQGRLSAFDIVIKYKSGFTRIRTPKHIHWVVDTLMKYQAEKTMTQQFISEIQNLWNIITPLANNDYAALNTFAHNIEHSFISNIQNQFNILSRYGEYNIEFIYFLIAFLILQEKTNMPNAFMFSNIINELLKLNIDIFKIVSTATHNGR